MAKGDHRYRKSLRDRFSEKIMPEPNSGCWLWTGAVGNLGYGVIGLGRRDQGIGKAHRVSWQLHRGKIPSGGFILHKCDQPACVNPDHLFCGSQSENMRDCVAKKRNFVPDNRGERAAWAKLTAIQVDDIARRAMTGPEYAAKYGVSRSAIYQIWSGRNWAWR
jgi:hypothetical protein